MKINYFLFIDKLTRAGARASRNPTGTERPTVNIYYAQPNNNRMKPENTDKLIELRTMKARSQGKTTYIALPKSSNIEYQRATYESGIIILTPIKTKKEVSP